MTLANIESPHNDRRSPGRPRTHPSMARGLTLLRPSAMLRTGNCGGLQANLQPLTSPTTTSIATRPLVRGATLPIQYP